MIDILSFTRCMLNEYITGKAEPSFRSDQIFSWLHEKHMDSFPLMSDIPKGLRDILEKEAYIEKVEIIQRLESADGTVKYLFRLRDNNYIEAVVIFYRKNATICISSQVGCARACSFCASGKGGLVRNLTVSEMLLQVYMIVADSDTKISNIVLMGIGEPFDNLCNVLRFCDIICEEKGMNFSNRSITISTCGITEGIRRLADENMKYTLSVSLHAANDTLRSSIMPVNDIYPLEVLMESCRRYVKKTKRRITFEYALIPGINDSDEDAVELARLIYNMASHINLIPVNNIEEHEYEQRLFSVETFKEKLQKLGVNVTVRRTLGNDICASCGQLRRSIEAKERS